MKENATTYREIDEVLEDIAKKWGAWDSVTKNAVTTAIAGEFMLEYIVIYKAAVKTKLRKYPNR